VPQVAVPLADFPSSYLFSSVFFSAL
jgi:hypothetical protein